MKLSRMGIVVAVVIIVGIVAITFNLRGREEKQNKQNLLNRGNYLISLISIYPIMESGPDQQAFFLRTLAEYTSQKGFVYLFIYNIDGKPLIALCGKDLAKKIPKNVRTKSLYTAELIKQEFQVNGSKDTIFEFAKPVFKNGKRSGTAILGLRLQSVSLLTIQRVSFLAMLILLIIAILLVGYYGLTIILKPVRSLDKTFLDRNGHSASGLKNKDKTIRIGPLLEDLEDYLQQTKNKLRQIESKNLDLVSKLSVTTFETNKIINILDSINFGIIITDIQENVDHINEYMLKLIRKNREEVIDRPFNEIINIDKITSFISDSGMIGRSMTVERLESVFHGISSDETFKVSVNYLIGGEKTPIGKIISFYNTTFELLKEKAKHDFIAHVSHEIITPITNIKSYCEMLMDGEVEDPEMQKEFYNTINDQIDRLTSMIKNLLNISKMEMGSLTINKELVKTDSLFEDCISSIEASALEKNITLIKNRPDIFPTFIADKELIKTAVVNLLGNALKYTPENGIITFSISENPNMVVFDIEDTGYGIAKEDLPHIFEKFYRASGREITAQTGSGLGLAITSEIVQLHGGKINVISRPEEGSHFSIELPMEEKYVG